MYWLDKYDEVDSIGGWDYDWEEFKLLRKKETGELFCGYDSGCSCSGFGDGLDEEDLIPVKNWQEAVEVAKGYTDRGYGDITEAAVFEFANRLAQG